MLHLVFYNHNISVEDKNPSSSILPGFRGTCNIISTQKPKEKKKKKKPNKTIFNCPKNCRLHKYNEAKRYLLVNAESWDLTGERLEEKRMRSKLQIPCPQGSMAIGRFKF